MLGLQGWWCRRLFGTYRVLCLFRGTNSQVSHVLPTFLSLGLLSSLSLLFFKHKQSRDVMWYAPWTTSSIVFYLCGHHYSWTECNSLAVVISEVMMVLKRRAGNYVYRQSGNKPIPAIPYQHVGVQQFRKKTTPSCRTCRTTLSMTIHEEIGTTFPGEVRGEMRIQSRGEKGTDKANGNSRRSRGRVKEGVREGRRGKRSVATKRCCRAKTRTSRTTRAKVSRGHYTPHRNSETRGVRKPTTSSKSKVI